MTEPRKPRIIPAHVARLEQPAKLTAKQKRAIRAWQKKQQPTKGTRVIKICGQCLRQPCARNALRCNDCERSWQARHQPKQPTEGNTR